MGRYNPISRNVEDSVIPVTRKYKRGYIVISALAWGIFSVPVKTHPFLLNEGPVPAAVASFRYILSNQGTDVVLAGVRSADEVEELVAVLDDKPLSKEEKASVVLNSLELGKGSGCTQCGVCMPCPEGIDIPLYYRYLTYIKEYKTYEYPSLTWQAYAAPFSKACTDCGICVERCPFDLSIPDDVRKVDSLVKDIRHPTYKDEYD
ncbi:MAG: 4Fe-4S dicluster domain-containing protein [Spirochaetales bacterium]|nr:4Fe-4S dicluster domain-containing protein [Spirochaetales bacterium]